MVLGDADHQEIASVLPVRLAEFPERAANRREPGGRHVDGAEAAMRGVVGRAELLGPPAGQRLALIATGEEGKLARIAPPDVAKPLGRDRQRLVPADRLELPGATRAYPQQGRRQPRRRVVV